MNSPAIDRIPRVFKHLATALIILALPIWLFPFALYKVITALWQEINEWLWDE